MPTAEEAEAVAGFEGDPRQLGTVEKWTRAVAAVPRLQQRLHSLVFLLSFPALLADLRGKLQAVRAGVAGLREPRNLLRALEVVLAVGNYLNGGTKRGQAWGFRLELLAKLGTIKASAASGAGRTLMHTVAHLMREHFPAAASGLAAELKECQPAAQHSMEQTAGDVKQLKQSVRQCQAEVTAVALDGGVAGSVFGEKVSAFIAGAVPQVEALEDELSELQQALKELAERFGETGPPGARGADQQGFAKLFFQVGGWRENRPPSGEREAPRQSSADPKATAVAAPTHPCPVLLHACVNAASGRCFRLLLLLLFFADARRV